MAMASAAGTVGGPAGPVYEIDDLKAAQEEIGRIFKNHTRNIRRLSPTKPKASYSCNGRDVITFELTNLDDYINLEGCQLYFKVNMHSAQGGEGKIVRSGLSPIHLFQRLRIYNGSTLIQDVDLYGDYVFMELSGRAQKAASYSSLGYFVTSTPHDFTAAGGVPYFESLDTEIHEMPHLNTVCTMNSEANSEKNLDFWVTYPLINCLERGGYLPTGTLAFPLKFELHLGTFEDCTWRLANAAASSGPPAYFPTIAAVDAGPNMVDSVTIAGDTLVFLIDTLKASFGAVVTASPYSFHSFGIQMLKQTITDGNSVYPFDLTYSSLKRLVSWRNLQKKQRYTMDAGVLGQYQNLLAMVPFDSCPRVGATELSYYVQIGGTLWPQVLPVDNNVERYYHQAKCFHIQDLMGVYANPMWQMTQKYVETSNTLFCGFLTCASFDRLDQTSTAVSGIDVETADVILYIEQDTAAGVSLFKRWLVGGSTPLDSYLDRYFCFSYDIYVMFENAQVVIQD